MYVHTIVNNSAPYTYVHIDMCITSMEKIGGNKSLQRYKIEGTLGFNKITCIYIHIMIPA